MRRIQKRSVWWEMRWEALATYNSEVERGIVHTKEYDEQMRRMQASWDRENKPR